MCDNECLFYNKSLLSIYKLLVQALLDFIANTLIKSAASSILSWRLPCTPPTGIITTASRFQFWFYHNPISVFSDHQLGFRNSRHRYSPRLPCLGHFYDWFNASSILTRNWILCPRADNSSAMVWAPVGQKSSNLAEPFVQSLFCQATSRSEGYPPCPEEAATPWQNINHLRRNHPLAFAFTTFSIAFFLPARLDDIRCIAF